MNSYPVFGNHFTAISNRFAYVTLLRNREIEGAQRDLMDLLMAELITSSPLILYNDDLEPRPDDPVYVFMDYCDPLLELAGNQQKIKAQSHLDNNDNRQIEYGLLTEDMKSQVRDGINEVFEHAHLCDFGLYQDNHVVKTVGDCELDITMCYSCGNYIECNTSWKHIGEPICEHLYCQCADNSFNYYIQDSYELLRYAKQNVRQNMAIGREYVPISLLRENIQQYNDWSETGLKNPYILTPPPEDPRLTRCYNDDTGEMYKDLKSIITDYNNNDGLEYEHADSILEK